MTFPLERAQLILKGSGMVAEAAGAVPSLEHNHAYYVAIRFSGSGVDHEVGVWATNDFTSGSVFSVDAFAEQFSNLPPRSGFSAADAGAEEARTCV